MSDETCNLLWFVFFLLSFFFSWKSLKSRLLKIQWHCHWHWTCRRHVWKIRKSPTSTTQINVLLCMEFFFWVYVLLHSMSRAQKCNKTNLNARILVFGSSTGTPSIQKIRFSLWQVYRLQRAMSFLKFYNNWPTLWHGDNMSTTCPTKASAKAVHISFHQNFQI